LAVIVIPAREGSTRLKEKLLIKVGGKAVIQWTVENCLKVPDVEKVVVATDSERIANLLKDYPVEVFMTPSDLNSGSDRVAYVSKNLNTDKVINVQGDEPLLDPMDIHKVIKGLDNAPVSTLSYPISSEEEYKNPNVVKVVVNSEGYALYFSRSPIPYIRDTNFTDIPQGVVKKHIGVYGYRKDTLMDFAYKLKPSVLEQVEKLEQLRLLENGYRIKVLQADRDTLGIDTQEDLERFKTFVSQNG